MLLSISISIHIPYIQGGAGSIYSAVQSALQVAVCHVPYIKETHTIRYCFVTLSISTGIPESKKQSSLCHLAKHVAKHVAKAGKTMRSTNAGNASFQIQYHRVSLLNMVHDSEGKRGLVENAGIQTARRQGQEKGENITRMLCMHM